MDESMDERMPKNIVAMYSAKPREKSGMVGVETAKKHGSYSAARVLLSFHRQRRADPFPLSFW